ncbi:MAG: hypothetical protein Q4E28_05065 [Clostridia bacterium]|nr:hypothetical protein [Clostridia bacterium]
MFEQGYISKLVDFQTYQKIDREISEKLHGIKTVDGIIIKSHSLHFIDRVIGHIFDVPKDKARNGVAIEDIKNTLLNYYEIKETEKSIRITGKRSRLSISKIYVGNLVQVNSYLGEVRK